MGDTTTQQLSKRERAANKLRSFAGIRNSSHISINNTTTTSPSTAFPSFRFSPESEEIHEVQLTSQSSQDKSNLSVSTESLEPKQDEGDQGSIPSSPSFRSPGVSQTAGLGDTSPIKEYIKKNWANKFDKKSLSLDLDLKGKFITAIEDKRKSIVSHFIPEETGLVPPVSGIKEHTGISVGEHSTLEQRSNSSGKLDSKVISFDSGKQEVKSNISQGSHSPNFKRSSSVDHILGKHSREMPDHDHEDFEELGIDLTEIDNGSLEDLHDSRLLGNINLNYLKWNYSAESLSAKYECSNNTSHFGEREAKTKNSNIKISEEQLSFKSLGKNILMDIMNHGLFKYFMVLFAIGLCLPGSTGITLISIYWFITGATFSTMLIQSMSTSDAGAGETLTKKPSRNIPPIGADWSIIPKQITNSQTWLLEYDGDYEPINVTYHNGKPVFARLEGSLLYLSTPTGGARIPRRVTCTDPELPENLEFSRHRVYNIEKATIFIAPEKLARRRVWNKKYPIGIKLHPASQLTVVSKAEPGMRSAISDSAINVCHSPIHQNSLEEPGTKPKKQNRTITHETCGKSTLYLFTRTDREKEEWFRRLVVGAKSSSPETSEDGENHVAMMEKYYQDYMSKLIPPGSRPHSSMLESNGNRTKSRAETQSRNGSNANTPTPMEKIEYFNLGSAPDSPTYLNAFLGRIFMNFLRSEHWTAEIHKLIQKKLNFIRRPPFLDVLILKKLDLGYTLPVIERASQPAMDHRGLWIDLDISYEGEFCLTIETRIDIRKLRKVKKFVEEEIAEAPTNVEEQEDDSQADDLSQGSNSSVPQGPFGNIYDSDADDSGEETSDEEFDPEAQFAENPELNTYSNQSPLNQALGSLRDNTTGSKFLKFVERMANSTFVSEMKMVQNAIGKVATTPISMIVQIKAASGVLVLNITPPPTDRLWFGFRYNPELDIVAKPQVGHRVININRITDWIGNKIRQQLTKVFVFPNMEEISVPLMEFQLPS